MSPNEPSSPTLPSAAAPAATKPKRRRLVRWVGRLSLALVSFAVALLLAELAVRLLATHRTRTPFAIDDPNFVYRNEAGVRGRHTSPGEFDYSFAVNSKGCRGKESTWEKPPRTRRLVCVGDSFTWGTGVADDQTYPAQLERVLNAQVDPSREQSYEVINAGVMSWNIAQYYIWARREGLRYQPDVLVVSMFDDDWEDALSGLVTEDEAGQLVEHLANFALLRKQRLLLKWVPFYRQIMTHSQLANLTMDALRSRVTWPPTSGHYLDSQAATEPAAPAQATKPAEPAAERAMRLTQHMLLELDRACRAAGTRLVIFWIPRQTSVQANLQLPPDSEAPKGPLTPATAPRVLKKYCAGQGIAFKDSTPDFIRIHRDQHVPLSSLYYQRDGHCRVEGYQVLADALAAYVRALEP